MQTLLRISGAVDRASDRVGKTVAWLTLLMVLTGAWNAVARYAGKSIGLDLSSNGLIEAQWYMFSFVFLLGAATTLRKDEHVRVDVLYGRLGQRGKAWVNVVGTLTLLLPFCVVGVVFSVEQMAQSFAVREGSPDPGGLPRYPLKALIPLALVLVLAQGLSQAIKSWAVISGSAGKLGANGG